MVEHERADPGCDSRTSTCSTGTSSPKACRTSGSPTCASTSPVFHHPEPHGPGFWVVSKHADVLAISRDPVTYSSDQDRGGVAPLEEPETANAGSGSQGADRDGPARAHAVPQARQPRVHAAHDQRAGTAHPRTGGAHSRPRDREGQLRLRRRRGGRAARGGDRRADRCAEGGSAQDLRVDEPASVGCGRTPSTSSPRSRCKRAQIEMFMYVQRALRAATERTPRRHHERTASGRAGRRQAHGSRAERVLPVPLFRRQRDDPQRSRSRSPCIPGKSRRSGTSSCRTRRA